MLVVHVGKTGFAHHSSRHDTTRYRDTSRRGRQCLLINMIKVLTNFPRIGVTSEIIRIRIAITPQYFEFFLALKYLIVFLGRHRVNFPASSNLKAPALGLPR